MCTFACVAYRCAYPHMNEDISLVDYISSALVHLHVFARSLLSAHNTFAAIVCHMNSHTGHLWRGNASYLVVAYRSHTDAYMYACIARDWYTNTDTLTRKCRRFTESIAIVPTTREPTEREKKKKRENINTEFFTCWTAHSVLLLVDRQILCNKAGSILLVCYYVDHMCD